MKLTFYFVQHITSNIKKISRHQVTKVYTVKFLPPLATFLLECRKKKNKKSTLLLI